MDGVHGDLHNMPLRVLAMKEEDYGMMMVYTYGTSGRVVQYKF